MSDCNEVIVDVLQIGMVEALGRSGALNVWGA
jgi:hypothetical protein